MAKMYSVNKPIKKPKGNAGSTIGTVVVRKIRVPIKVNVVELANKNEDKVENAQAYAE